MLAHSTITGPVWSGLIVRGVGGGGDGGGKGHTTHPRSHDRDKLENGERHHVQLAREL